MSERFHYTEYRKKIEMEITNPKYKLLLMDFHGTIADRQLWSLNGINRTWISLFEIRAQRDVYQNALTRRGGKSYKNYLNEILDADSRIEQYIKDTSRNILNKEFDKQMSQINIPMPGMRRVMRKILNSGIQVAVISNGSLTESIRETLEDWRLPELSQNFYNGTIMKSKKPDPTTIYYVLEQFNKMGHDYDLRDVLVVGDQVADTQVAKNAGVHSALIIRPIQEKEVAIVEPYPTYVINDPLSLIDIVAGKKEPLPQKDNMVTVYPSFFQYSAQF